MNKKSSLILVDKNLFRETNLKTVFDGIWEVFQGTNWDRLFWRVAWGAIRFGDAGNNDLSITHGSKGAYSGVQNITLELPKV